MLRITNCRSNQIKDIGEIFQGSRWKYEDNK